MSPPYDVHLWRPHPWHGLSIGPQVYPPYELRGAGGRPDARRLGFRE